MGNKAGWALSSALLGAVVAFLLAAPVLVADGTGSERRAFAAAAVAAFLALGTGAGFAAGWLVPGMGMAAGALLVALPFAVAEPSAFGFALVGAVAAGPIAGAWAGARLRRRRG